MCRGLFHHDFAFQRLLGEDHIGLTLGELQGGTVFFGEGEVLVAAVVGKFAEGAAREEIGGAFLGFEVDVFV